MTYICDFFFHMFHILRVLKILYYYFITDEWFSSTNLSSAAVRNSSLILGCHTPDVKDATWPFVLAMSVMYMSPLTYSAFSKPSRSRTLAWQFPEMISTRSPVIEYWTYLIGWLWKKQILSMATSNEWNVHTFHMASWSWSFGTCCPCLGNPRTWPRNPLNPWPF